MVMQLKPEDRRAYRVQEFCALYGLSRSTVYKMIQAGTLRTVRIGGRRLIPKESGEALLNPQA